MVWIMKKLQLSRNAPYRMGMVWDPIGAAPAVQAALGIDSSVLVSLSVIRQVWDGGGRLQEPIQNYSHSWVINQINRDGDFI